MKSNVMEDWREYSNYSILGVPLDYDNNFIFQLLRLVIY